MLQEPLTRRADRCVKRFAKGQIEVGTRQGREHTAAHWDVGLGLPMGLWKPGQGWGVGNSPARSMLLILSGNIHRRGME